MTWIIRLGWLLAIIDRSGPGEAIDAAFGWWWFAACDGLQGLER